MKLHEIVDTQFRDTKFPGKHKPRPPVIDDPAEDWAEKLNKYVPPSLSGAFGTVKPMPRNPHEVYKTTQYSFDENDPDEYDNGRITYDGYYAWVSGIAPYAKSNPYLPRVYVIDKKTDENGRIRPRYQLEKLFNYNEVPFSVLRALYLKEVPDATDDMFDELKHGTRLQITKKRIWMDIIYGVLSAADNRPGTNPQADELVELIYSINNENEPDIDNPDNTMIRLTSIGPQVVFVDPVSFIGE